MVWELAPKILFSEWPKVVNHYVFQVERLGFEDSLICSCSWMHIKRIDPFYHCFDVNPDRVLVGKIRIGTSLEHIFKKKTRVYITLS